MANQFEKRKAKAEAALKSKKSEVPKQMTAEEMVPEGVKILNDFLEGKEAQSTLTHEAYDIYLSSDGRTYQAVIFKYNPADGTVVIEKQQPIQRGIALSHEINKRSLKTLLKRK